MAREERRNGALVYVLYAAPGPDQYLLTCRDRAMEHAVAFAAFAGVRAWLVDENGDSRPLGDSAASNVLCTTTQRASPISQRVVWRNNQ